MKVEISSLSRERVTRDQGLNLSEIKEILGKSAIRTDPTKPILNILGGTDEDIVTLAEHGILVMKIIDDPPFRLQQ